MVFARLKRADRAMPGATRCVSAGQCLLLLLSPPKRSPKAVTELDWLEIWTIFDQTSIIWLDQKLSKATIILADFIGINANLT